MALPPLSVNITVENNCSDDEGCCCCFPKKKKEVSEIESSTRIERIKAKTFEEVVIVKPAPLKRQKHHRDLTKYPIDSEKTKSKLNVKDIQDVIGDEWPKTDFGD